MFPLGLPAFGWTLARAAWRVRADHPQRRISMPAMPDIFRLDRLKTPIGVALLVSDGDGVLRALDWEDYEVRMRELLRLQCGAVELKEARAPVTMKTALTGYFKGDLDRISE